MYVLKGKQTRYLRSLAHHLNPLVQVGKSGISGNLLEQVDLALEAHELIKVTVLETSPLSRDEVGRVLVEETGAACVQMIGRLVVLYRPSTKEAKIHLPKV